MSETTIVGWDVGGAHLKAAVWRAGEVLDTAQWVCPLWLGMEHLDHALAQARARWPHLATYRHAVTMTGEMAQMFPDREHGVQRLADHLNRALPSPRFFAGDAGWLPAPQTGAHWAHVASANWLATARHVAQHFAGQRGLLVDIGSTTTDLIAFADGRVLTDSRTDVQRLTHGELVYQGVVRTPLCALGPRITWRGARINLMNEEYATTADVYRLTGELDPRHDQQPSADGHPKDVLHSRIRIARMIGMDAHLAGDDEWLAFARTWRQHQLAELRGQLERVAADRSLGPGALAVSAGCGAFLVPELLPAGWRLQAFGPALARLATTAPREATHWAEVAATAVSVAALFGRESR